MIRRMVLVLSCGLLCATLPAGPGLQTRSLEAHFKQLLNVNAGTITYRYKATLTSGLSGFGRLTLSAKKEHGKYELYMETTIPILRNKKTYNRMTIQESGTGVREEIDDGIKLYSVLTFNQDDGKRFLRHFPLTGDPKDYPLPTQAFPTSLFLTPFLAYCQKEFVIHWNGVPAWIVHPELTSSTGPVDRIRFRTTQGLEGSSTLPSQDLQDFVVACQRDTGIPTLISGSVHGYKVKIWR